MWDMFCDGWDGAELFVESSPSSGLGLVKSYSPSCSLKEVNVEFCDENITSYYLELSHPNKSYHAKNTWEDQWSLTFTNKNIDGTHIYEYRGGYETAMKLEFNSLECEWEVEIFNATETCDEDNDDKRCNPDRCPIPDKNKKKPEKKPEKETNSTSSVSKPKPKYGPPAVNLQLRMTQNKTSSKSNCSVDYLTPSWYLADNIRGRLFYEGSLKNENESEEYWSLCLGDGSYTIRFIGEDCCLNSNFSSVKWDFCGMTSSAPSELTFHVKKGECYADVVSPPCFEGKIQSIVTLEGELLVSGYTHESLSVEDASSLTSLVRSVVSDWDSFRVISSALDADEKKERKLSSNNGNNKNNNKNNKNNDNDENDKNRKTIKRQLKEFSFTIQFEVDFVAETVYGVDGRDYSSLISLVSSLESSISSLLSSQEVDLSLVIVLSELRLENVEYVGVPSLIPSTLTEPDWSFGKSSRSSSSSSTISFYLFDLERGSVEGVLFGGLLMIMAVVAMVVARSRAENSYDNISAESDHSTHETGQSSHNFLTTTTEVTLSEMDETIAPTNHRPQVYPSQLL